MSEPVAWMEYIQDEEWELWFDEPKNLPKGRTCKPLYTHELNITDDEILDIWHEMRTDTGGEILDFVRAIFKKAQEK